MLWSYSAVAGRAVSHSCANLFPRRNWRLHDAARLSMQTSWSLDRVRLGRSLEALSCGDGRQQVTQTRGPTVEAEAKDEDGVVVHIRLHVVAGKPVELEFFREDGATVKRKPHASALELVVLPPMPKKGWGHPAQDA